MVADVLGRLVPARLDVALGLAALVLALLALAQCGLATLPISLAPLGAPLALLGGALLWRDSPTLFGLNLLGVVTVAALASPRLRAVGRRRAGLGDYAAGAGELGAAGAAGAAALVFRDIDWASLPIQGRVRRARGAVVGLAAAVPVAAVFGGLLMRADPVFDRLVSRSLRLDVAPLASHLAQVGLWAWLGRGRDPARLPCTTLASLYPGAAGERWALARWARCSRWWTSSLPRSSLVQFRYLFGGADLVRGLTGMSYAEYARRGFFELVAVAALSLPLLLLADWSLDQREPARARRFRWLAGLMLLLLDVMLASALFRMRLYTAEYGLTELRFYTTAFMGWLVLVLGWFGATVLRGRRERFGTGRAAGGMAGPGRAQSREPGRDHRERQSGPCGGWPAARPGVRRAGSAPTPCLRSIACSRRSAHRMRAPRPGGSTPAGGEELASRRRWTISLARAPRAPIGCGMSRGGS